MQGVLTGFVIIASVIVVGYLLGRRGSLGGSGREVLTRVAFQVATPALLFVTVSEADLSTLFSARLLAAAISFLAVAGVFVAVAVARRWGVGPGVVGALCAGYVNIANLGIPVAVYVLDDISLVAPVLLFQQLVVSPVVLTTLDLTAGPADARVGTWRRLTTPFRNPIVLGSLAGVAVAASGLTPPAALMEPATLLGNMAVPAVLLAFGISLHGSELPGRGPDRAQVLLAVALKSLVAPLLAWLLTLAFGLDRDAQLLVVVTVALPTAQNVFTYASHYGVGLRLAREAVLLSTALSVPVLTVIAALLG
ncbi:AEC family transporter [Streptomyces sp. 3MP-14]|uniref:AEC family transporter n=1 Tax=Streptomyces mimosae TaxID=2586635 RepID=A0A5N6A636_9ACTN|nr:MULTISPECIES: AEC family transporter [Streptomyces]KAB8163443.1 AEC family transporter [Streptomyces mimosae]KAB8174720.1 AEC family transporter [Streptomyces sp. 3MP-14]